MRATDIHRMDLNLLRVFMALMEEGSVTAAGDRLGLAQSSISHALTRLRAALDNPLFVRTTRGMQPTPLALSLAEPIGNALLALEKAFDQGRAFDPAASSRVFQLLMTDVVELIVLPPLMHYLHETNCKVGVVTTQLPRASYRDSLETGKADLALGQLPASHTDFFQQLLFQDDLACVMRAENPVRRDFTLASYLEADHLIVGTPAVSELLVKKALGSQASQRRVGLYVPHYIVAPFIIADTDLIAVLPRSVCRTFARMGNLVELPLPFYIPPTEVRQFWHARSNHDPGCQWLRRVIAQLFAGSGTKSRTGARP